jgi:hypothetical protein
MEDDAGFPGQNEDMMSKKVVVVSKKSCSWLFYIVFGEERERRADGQTGGEEI